MAATRLFSLKGYHATGINEILRESKTPKGSLYYYFPNGKEELAIEAIELTRSIIKEDLNHELSKIEDPAESIKHFIKNMVNKLNIKGNMDSFNKETISIDLVALETYSNNENLRKACESAFDTWQNVYAEKLIQGGFSREKSEELSLVIQSIVEGAIVMSLTKKSSEPIIKVANSIPYILNQ